MIWTPECPALKLSRHPSKEIGAEDKPLIPRPGSAPRKLAASDSAKIQEGIGSSPNSALPKLREHGPHDRSPASEPRTQLQLWSKLTFSSPRTPSFSPKNRSKYTAPISHREHILFLQKSPSHPCRSARAELNQMKAPFFESSWRTRVNLAPCRTSPEKAKPTLAEWQGSWKF
ncbi:unnamed protein product [Prunus armeniaca]|uniref:Uncharacterized protein n=1 Tax=Prunus armeniaca TaxID=36596 RepID=A0A6J5XMQ2_PRUAR|nr:unnamed protein product [Prunus armeniaca]